MSKKLFLVDDDRRLVEALKDYLEDCGYDVYAAFDGAGIFEMAHAQKPSLIILDADMPLVGGVQTLKRLRHDSGTAHIPVILMTGLSSARVYPDIESLPLVSYVKKPVDPEDLLSIIHHYLPPSP